MRTAVSLPCNKLCLNRFVRRMGEFLDRSLDGDEIRRKLSIILISGSGRWNF